MNEAPDPEALEILDYVRSSARLLALPLSEAQSARVALHLIRTRDLAARLSAVPMRPDDDIAEIYRPAPFPDHDPELPT